ncbi:MAG: 30S ribosomal protein S6 [Spirochaetes bacterium]|nr:MAG: 30S ribosomal protein S6 [Spirochaetota bacterium]
MRKYESVIIFNTEEGNFEQGREFFKKQLAEFGAQVIKEEDMGERNLAYLVKKHDRGHYYLYEFESSPEKIKAIEKSIKLRPEILKVLFVRKDK